MEKCSVIKELRIVPGDIEDYRKLEMFHYRGGCPGFWTKIFAIKRKTKETVGVIVYTMPAAGCEMRNVATKDIFAGFDGRTRLGLINKNIRCISRVIIEPRYRGIGLASRLVRETMPKMDIPIVEALAVMGRINPFFEKAGMKVYETKQSARCIQLAEAFSVIGIKEGSLIDAEEVQKRIKRVRRDKREFIEQEISQFLQVYGDRRNMGAGLERMKFVLSRMAERPLYYIWFNKNMELRN
ncbi:MAG: hypothetical protein JW947_09070 [Sedimentisphaerales bacterium]|nr:hypothetical protein [Sedimentisphaerales bacterium]